MSTSNPRAIAIISFCLTAVFISLAPGSAAADIATVGPEFRVNSYTTGSQYAPRARSASMSAEGSSVVVWVSNDQDGNGRGVFGQRFDAAGAPDGTEFQINSYTTYTQRDAAVSSALNGSFVVVWGSNSQDGDLQSIHGQRFDAAGAPDGTEFQINSYTTGQQYHPAVSSAADGSFVVVWHSMYQDGHFNSVQGQRFDAAGASVGTEFQVNSYTTGSQFRPAVSSSPDGSFVTVWQSYGTDGDQQSVRRRSISDFSA